MSDFECQVEVEEVLEDRDDSAKKELVGALINAIENLEALPTLAQKHQIFHAIETILDHHVMDGKVLINEILPHVFNLLKEEVPKEEFYAVCMLNHIAKKCVESRKAMFDIAEYLMEQLKANFKLFHDELFDIVDKYGEIMSITSFQEAVVITTESTSSDNDANGEYIEAGETQVHSISLKSESNMVAETDSETITTNERSHSSSSLLSFIPSVISRTISSSSVNSDKEVISMPRRNSWKSSNSLLDLVLPTHHEAPPSTPPPDLPYDTLPTFIKLLRKNTDLHYEAENFLKFLSASSGADFDPDHHISAFLSNFSEWNDRSRSKSSRMLREMVKLCDRARHVDALLEMDIFMELVEVLQGGSFATKREALWLVQILASQPLFHNAMVESPVLKAIVDLLAVEGKVTDISMEAFWTLEMCCKEECLREAIFLEGGMPGLIHVVKQLHIDDPEPLRVLSFLTHDDTLDTPKEKLSERNIVSHVVSALRDGSVEEQIQAQELLITLAKGVSVHHLTSAFVDSDALPVLLEMLTGKHKLKVRALRILRLLAKGHLMRRMIVDSDSGLATLVGMVKTGPDEIKLGAGRVLGLMISDPDTHNDVLMSGLLHIALAFITHDHGGKGKWDSNQNSYETKLLSVEILSLFAANEKTKETLSHTEINTHLKHLMHHETGVLKEHAHDLLTCMEGEGKMQKILHHLLHRHHDE